MTKIKTKTKSASAFFCILLLPVAAFAQHAFSSGAAVAATGPSLDISTGYIYLFTAPSGQNHIILNGLDAAASINFARRWGLTVDASGSYAGNVLGTGQRGDVETLLAGPVFYPFELRRARIFLRGLAGASRVESAIPVDGIFYLNGWLTRPSFAAGGGMEHALTARFALRMSADYLRTSFYNSARLVQPQNNARLTVSFVYRLKPR